MRNALLGAAVVVMVTIALPASSAHAQSGPALTRLDVQLRPEYDQPSMLILYDFEVEPLTELPARLTFRIPETANLTAVASQQGEQLLNAQYEGPVREGAWQVFTVIVATTAAYRVEYYQPLKRTDGTRTFEYEWPGSFNVEKFSVSVLQPPDTLSWSTVPALQDSSALGALTLFSNSPVSIAAGESFTLVLEYDRQTEELVVPPSGIQPVTPIGEETAGRVSIEQYLPFILGGAGITIVLAGVVYYLLSGRSSGRRRRRRRMEPRQHLDTGIYCPQCGSRAEGGDQFCRVCGTRLGKKD